MSARDAAFLGCRLMALWFAVQGISVTPGALAARMSFGEVPELRQGPFAQMFVENAFLLTPASLLLFSAILFYGANSFSRMLVRNPDVELRPLSASKLFRIGALLIGINVAAEYLPTIVGKVILLFEQQAPEAKGGDLSPLVANIVGLVFAIALVLWAVRIEKRNASDTPPP